MNMKNSNIKAFTLIDLLLSVAIVSLLSSLFLFNVTDAKKRAQDSQMQSETHEVANAVALYKADNNGFVPLTSTGGGTGTPGVMHSEADSASDYQSTMQTLVNGGYLARIPTSPSGMSYVYGTSEDQTSAVFATRLNKPSSGSNKNSCQIDFDIEFTAPRYNFEIGTCTNGGRAGNPCDGYPVGTDFGGAVCLERTAGDVSAYCQINSGVYSVKPEYQYYFHPDFCSSSVTYDVFLCSAILLEDEEVVETAKCDGSSDSDYCSCI